MPRFQQPPTFVPKVGDLVYFYFLHAFSEKRVDHEGYDVELYNGRSEMRCRPARVVEVVLEYEEGTSWSRWSSRMTIASCRAADERCIVLSAGIMPCRAAITSMVTAGSGIGWPRDGQWGDKPKTV
jgi:hypothetical protein